MPRLTLAFFMAAALFGVGGMAWSLANGLDLAHAHLNLVGWVGLSLMGLFYAFTGPEAPVRLGWANFLFSTVGFLVLAAGLPRLVAGDRSEYVLVVAGVVVTYVGLMTFAAAVLTQWSPLERRAA